MSATTVIFDVGNVIVDWNREYLYARLIPDAAERQRFLTEICPPAWNAARDLEDDFQAATALLAAEYPQHAAWIEAHDTNWQEMLRGLIPGTAELIADLDAARVPLYAITNFNTAKFRETVARFPDLFRPFRGVAMSGELKVMKPDPAIYRWLIDRFALTPADCVFLDDVPANVEGARAVGMKAIHFTGAAEARAQLKQLGLPLD